MMGSEHEDEDVEGVDDQPGAGPVDGVISDSVIDEELAALIDDQVAADHAAAESGLTPDQISEEAVVALIAERDDYLDQLQRASSPTLDAVATNVLRCKERRLQRT